MIQLAAPLLTAPLAVVERQLLDSAHRLLRAPEGRTALALHLSRLAPPAPRPHHRRIARALMAEAASCQDGQVYPLRNGDLVLLCRGAVEPLAATCTRLFRVDAPDPDALLSAWTLDRDGDALVRYAAARIADAPPPPEPESPLSLRGADAVAQLVDGSRLSDLVQRQTAVLLQPGAGFRPLFREIVFSRAVLESRLAVAGQAHADPLLFRHLAARLEQRVLDAVSGGMAEPLAPKSRQMLHLNLTLAGAASEAFAQLTDRARERGLGLGVEIALLDALADPAAFHGARDALRAAGVAVVLDGVSHPALAVTNPALLGADMVKLDWHAALPDAGLNAALTRLEPERMVLHRADTEAAVTWGLSQGIRRFQGKHVDNMLAAGRLSGCAAGQGCTLRQCAERASATGPAGRAGCRNPALLDAGPVLHDAGQALHSAGQA